MNNYQQALFKTNPYLVLLNGNSGQPLLWHTSECWERQVSPQMALLVGMFAIPRTIISASAELQLRYQEISQTEVQEIIEILRENNILIPYEPVGTLTPIGKGGMFGAPVLPLAEIMQGDLADVVFVGIPYDVAVTHRPGCRFAPNYLRRISGTLFQYKDTEQGPPGAWDLISKQRILEGIRFADAGDMVSVVFERNGEAFENLEQVVRNLANAGRLPVILGGDHSITLPVVRGLATTFDKLGVIHFDAHSDYGGAETIDWQKNCHHGNFMNWIIHDERIECVVQFGIRQLTTKQPPTATKLFVWPGITALHHQVEELLAVLPEDLPYHLTIDVDCLDPTVIPTTGTPLPGGFSHSQFISLCDLLCRNRKIVGIDLVELIPGTSETEGLIVADILLRAIAAVTDGQAQ